MAASDPTSAAATSAVGRRVRALRRRLGMSQAELAGETYSAAYVSTIETGRRRPSVAMLRHLAAKLGVDVADLSSDGGAEWAIELARDLQSQGQSPAAQALLERALTNLAGAGRVAPGVLMVLHREIARGERDPAEAERHLRRALEYARGGDVAATELALTYVGLGDALRRRARVDAAADAYRDAARVLLDLLRRPPEDD